MQNGVREHGIEWFGKIEAGGIAGNERELRIIPARLGQHIGRTVQAYDLRARARDFSRKLAGAAAQIQNALAGLGGQQLQKIRAVAPHERMFVLIAPRVPGAGS